MTQKRPVLPQVLHFDLGAPTACFFEIVEYRCPKKGEFYVSGAIPEAYRALNDFPSPYWIVRPTHRAERVTTFRKGTPVTLTEGA